MVADKCPNGLKGLNRLNPNGLNRPNGLSGLNRPNPPKVTTPPSEPCVSAR